MCAFTAPPFSLSVYVGSVNLLPTTVEQSPSLYGNDAENVRSDKDSEPETYGEGIKKEIQYRRTPFIRTNRFSGPRKIVAQANSIKDTVFAATKAGFSTRRGATLVAGKNPWQLADFSVGRSVG